MNKKIIIAAVLIAVLFVSAIVGTIFYYNGVVSDNGSKIASLNTRITNLNAQISILEGHANIASSYLVTSLGIAEIPAQVGLGGLQSYNHLWISGIVTNRGLSPAYHVGFVFAYAANGKLEVNITVPLNPLNNIPPSGGHEWVGTDAKINAWLVDNGDSSSLQLGNLDHGATAEVDIQIFHKDTVSSWTITPVCTNSP